MIRHITCAAESIVNAAEAPAKIDRVIRTALKERKPAYLEIACNIADAECVRPGPVTGWSTPPTTDEVSLQAAITMASEWLNRHKHVVILIGSKLRAANAENDVVALADRLQCAVCLMAGAQGLFPHDHPLFRGLYWENISSEEAQALVESADALICIAPAFNDNYMVYGGTVERFAAA